MNFQQIKEYLEKFPESFSVTAISETWIKNSKGADFQLHGYELKFRNRENKGGGGVTLYVNKDMKYTRTDVMSTAMDNLMECTTIKLIVEDAKNILISCIYRAADSSMGTFRDLRRML